MQKTNDVKKVKTDESAVKETKAVTEPAVKETKPVAAKKAEETTKKETQTKKSTAKKDTASKTTATKTTASKSISKGTETKTASKSTSRKKVAETVYVQYAGREFELSGIVERAKAAYTGDAKKIKEISVYVKPEENMIYFVVNGEETGSVEL